MGRGRAKAKQTKVARELKYFSPATDLDRLRAELRGEDTEATPDAPPADEDEHDDPYADPYAEADDLGDEEADPADARR